MAALWLHGCAGSRPSSQGFLPQNRTSGNGGSDHPLASLSFPQESILSSQLKIQQIETPIHTGEGRIAWHKKGSHPYAYRVSREVKTEDWEAIRNVLHTPPIGVRSGVPLGGLGTGTIELRADGRLADWQIFNNSPGGGGGKVDLDEAFFAIRTAQPGKRVTALALRTTPPASLPGVEQIGYAGAFPVSRLQFRDKALPLSVSLYGYGIFDPNDTILSNTPAIVFSFTLTNPTSSAIQTSLMYNQPNYLAGTYRTERGLVLSKKSNNPKSGELCVAFASGLPASSMVAGDLESIWTTFETEGTFEKNASLGLFDHGAIASTVTIEPGASRTISFVLSWHFPNLTIAGERIGNAYSTRYQSASDVNADVIHRLPAIWRSLKSWNLLTTNASLPDPVKSGLKNSLSQLYKTSFCTENGRWRSWDSFSNASVSSMDLNLYRALPLMYFYPQMLTSLLRAYAASQSSDGMIPDNLGRGQHRAIDEQSQSSKAQPANSRSTATFFILTKAQFSTLGDPAFLKELWPHLMKALTWQLSITTPEGLPSNLPAVSDWATTSGEKLLLQDATLHLTGLQALVHIAQAIDRSDDVAHLKPVILLGLKSLSSLFGTPSGYKTVVSNVFDSQEITSGADEYLFSGFLWAYLLNFQNFFDETQIAAFLENIQKNNQPPLLPGSRGSRQDKNANRFMPASAMNWAALQISNNKSTSRAFQILNELFQHQQNELADPWGHFALLSNTDGMPYAYPHHASHLAIWFTIAALSGQQFDAVNKRLHFHPKLASGSRIPFFLPDAKGLLHIQKSGKYTLQVVSGRLELRTLEIGNEILYRDILLEEGQFIALSPHK